MTSCKSSPVSRVVLKMSVPWLSGTTVVVPEVVLGVWVMSNIWMSVWSLKAKIFRSLLLAWAG